MLPDPFQCCILKVDCSSQSHDYVLVIPSSPKRCAIIIGVSVVISVLITVVLMCLRESNKKATDDVDKDELLLEEIESLDQIGDM